MSSMLLSNRKPTPSQNLSQNAHKVYYRLWFVVQFWIFDKHGNSILPLVITYSSRINQYKPSYYSWCQIQSILWRDSGRSKDIFGHVFIIKTNYLVLNAFVLCSIISIRIIVFNSLKNTCSSWKIEMLRTYS